MRDTYFPLFSSIVRSSLWGLSGDCIKVFMTVCAEADPEGQFCGSVDGLRRIADLPIEDIEKHLLTLESPDPYSKDISRDPERDGRRLERVPNGWRVVNLEWYREEARRQSELARKRRWWDEKGSARRSARRTKTETKTNTPSECIPPTPTAEEPQQPQAQTITVHGVAKYFHPPEDLEPDARNKSFAAEFKLDLERVLSKFKAHSFTGPKKWQLELYSWLKQEKAWAERDRAREMSRAQSPANCNRGTRHSDDPGTRGHERFEPDSDSRKMAEEHGIDWQRLAEQCRRNAKFMDLPTPQQQHQFRRRVETLAETASVKKRSTDTN